MPGQFQLSVDQALEKLKVLNAKGLKNFILFGIPDSKDEVGSPSWLEDGIVQRALRTLKEHAPESLIATDLCFCEYTSHGHCGVLREGKLDNDATLVNLARQAISHARAGADLIAPSGMIDGAVKAIRAALDGAGFDQTPIMAYSAKHASGFYGPFREAAQSAPQFGDRKSYQMDPANLLEALREVELDIQEGADIVMVKPAISCLDIIYAVKQRFQMPTAAYNVSGEYAMVHAAASKGWIDGERVALEMLTSIRRAGADIIITYFAEQFADAYAAGKTDH
jgi:porphobilinogen synthase